MLVLIALQSGVVLLTRSWGEGSNCLGSDFYQSPIQLHDSIQFRQFTYLVTLKTRRRRSALSAERPKEPARSRMLTQTTSMMEPIMTMQSNLLKAEEK